MKPPLQISVREQSTFSEETMGLLGTPKTVPVPPKKSGSSNHRHSSNQKVGTPWALVRAIEAKFGGPMTFDLAASEENKKAPKYFDEETDSLKQDWHAISGNLWINPPFGLITPWAEKCAMEMEKGARIFLLTPASVDANWWTNFVHHRAAVFFLSPRIQFDGHDDPFPKPIVLSVFSRPNAPAWFDWYQPWRWKE